MEYNWQITKVQTSKKLLEFVDKLKPPKNLYASLHDEYSRIGITICDYSKGTGENSVSCYFNLQPAEIKLLLEKVKLEMLAERIQADDMTARIGLLDRKGSFMIGLLVKAANLILNATRQTTEKQEDIVSEKRLTEATKPYAVAAETKSKAALSQVKIIGKKVDAEGYSVVSKLTICRSSHDKQGNVSMRPWYVGIENGRAIPETSASGTCKCKSGTYKLIKSAFINLTDDELLMALCRVDSFIAAFEAMQTDNIAVCRAQSNEREPTDG